MTVLHGDGTSLSFLREERLGTSDWMLAVTGSDEVNLMSSLLARELGVEPVIEHRDPRKGDQRRTVAEGLPIGLPAGPGMPPPYVPTGVAVGPDGSVYVSADRNNAIYRVRPQR